MAKFTRTAYVSASLREVVSRVASLAYLTNGDALDATYDDLSARKTADHRKRVRITILVEPEKAPPKRRRGPKRPRPVQLALDVAPAAGATGFATSRTTCEEKDMGGAECPAGQCSRDAVCHRPTLEHFVNGERVAPEDIGKHVRPGPWVAVAKRGAA